MPIYRCKFVGKYNLKKDSVNSIYKTMEGKLGELPLGFRILLIKSIDKAREVAQKEKKSITIEAKFEF